MIPIPEDSELQDPTTVPIKREEAREQARLVACLRRRWHLLPDNLRPVVFAVPNGGSRDAKEAMNLKTQGVLAGVPDICILFHNGELVLIEMKAKDGMLSGAQVELHRNIIALGHQLFTAYSAEDALSCMRDLSWTN